MRGTDTRLTAKWRASALLAGFVAAAGTAAAQPGPAGQATAPRGQSTPSAPEYRYDPTWPKLPLPNGWVFQGITGMYVDSQDVIWVLNRPRDFDRDNTQNYASLDPPSARCCRKPPAVMAFDQDGNLLHAWGDPDSIPGWPRSEHTILVDSAGFVWVGGAMPGDTLLIFSRDGELVGEFGRRGPAVEFGEQTQDNQQTEVLMRGVAAAEFDEPAREIYIADGYLNRRVLVFDLDTGAFKRGWGAYGKPLEEISNELPPPYDPSAPPHGDFQGSVHAVRISNDGLVYVSDRQGNRIQVFTKQGEFVQEHFVAPWTRDRGAAGSITFSLPPEQAFLFVTDIMNNVVWVLNRRTGEPVGQVGFMGHSGGGFHWVHVAASDSAGNLYTGEVDSGKRIQKFVPAGRAP